MSRSVQLTTTFLICSTLVGTNPDSRWHGPASWNSLRSVGGIHDHKYVIQAFTCTQCQGAMDTGARNSQGRKIYQWREHGMTQNLLRDYRPPRCHKFRSEKKISASSEYTRKMMYLCLESVLCLRHSMSRLYSKLRRSTINGLRCGACTLRLTERARMVWSEISHLIHSGAF